MTLAPKPILLALALLASPAATLSQQPLTADTIMAQVAANQDRAESERARYVYIQHARIVSRKGGTVMCEEITDSRITPSPTGSNAELLKLNGRVKGKQGYIPYTTLSKKQLAKRVTDDDHDSVSISTGDNDTDRDLVEDLRSDLIHDKSKDGIDARLFPLTSKNQQEYLFHMAGREHKNGREVFHIDFRPKDKSDFGWKGDAYIDTTSYQPVVVRTDMSRKVPLAVRTLLGTNVPGLGFTVVYAPQADGVWFPISFGTEFKIHILFLFSRQIILDAQNASFEKTHVNTRILSTSDPIDPTPPPTQQ